MRKNEKGVLAVETSIVLTFCVLLILFLFSFARVYSAQSTVSHAVIQASDAVALESYLREVSFNGSEEDVLTIASRITGAATLNADSFISLREADVATLAKEKFTYAVGKTEAEADEKLKKLGVKNGLAGVDFSASSMELGNDDVVVFASYTIEMQFPVLGLKDIDVTKAARSKTFGDILFGIETLAEDPKMGSASGGGNYKHGTQVQITATPKYGYEFVGWTDGSSANPRTVTVNGAATYVARFRARDFGVNLVSSPAEGGTTTGGGTYKYLESTVINATAAEGYTFKEWEIYRHEDRTTTNIASAETPISIDQTYTCTAKFKINSYTVSVRTEGTSAGSASIVHNGQLKTSVTANYKTTLKLSAPDIANHKFLGWKEAGASSYFSTNKVENITIPAKNVTYVACYELMTSKVEFLGPDGNVVKTIVAKRNQTFSQQGLSAPANLVVGDKVLTGWKNFSASSTVIERDIRVSGNWLTPSITISGGSTEVNSTKLTAKTVPENVSVSWSSSNAGVVSVKNDGTVTANERGTTAIVASFVLNGKTYSATKMITTKPSIVVFHFARRDGFCSYSASQCTYGPSWWGRINSQSLGMRFYYDYFPGENPLDPKYGNYAKGVNYYEYDVTWSQIQGATRVAPQKQLTRSMIVHDTATTGIYAGKVNPQVGYNAGSQDALIFYDGVYDKIYYIKECHAAKPGGGYYDFYISQIS